MSTRALTFTPYRTKTDTIYLREIVLRICLAALFAASLASAFTHRLAAEDSSVLAQFGP